MKRTFYIQSRSGDYNHKFTTSRDTGCVIAKIRKDGGYFASQDDEYVFVPWHEISFIKISEIDITEGTD